jgi:predicted membrane protein
MDKYDTLEYSWVKATAVYMCLWISLCAFKNTNKFSDTIAGETIGVKILILILMSTNLVITSFCGITPVLLNYGINRTTHADLTFRQTSTRKEERNTKEPKVHECS